MIIETRKLSELKPAGYNPRKISDKALSGLKASIKRFGMIQPIIENKRTGNIVGGHQRLKALLDDGVKETQVIVIDIEESEEKALNVTLNNPGIQGEFTEELPGLLSEILEEIGEEQFEELGLDELVEDIVEPEDGLTDPDAVPEVVEPTCKLGELWILGNHRLLCGDATKAEDVERLMDGEKADMVFTDPPYNVASDSKNFASDVSKAMGKLAESDWDKDFNIAKPMELIRASCSDNVTIYIWTSHFLAGELWKILNEWADFTSYLVWSKPNPMPSLSKRHPTWNTELCVYASKGSKRIVNFPNEGHFLSCREVVKKSDGSHPTQKPIELIMPLIGFSSGKNQSVLDLFGGSGSTLIACERLNRKCYMMEIDPHYCDVIIKRWEDFTGSKAVQNDE